MLQFYFFYDTHLPGVDPRPCTHRHFSPKTLGPQGALLQELRWICSTKDNSGWSWLDSGPHDTTGLLSFRTNQSVWPTQYAVAKNALARERKKSRDKV